MANCFGSFSGRNGSQGLETIKHRDTKRKAAWAALWLGVACWRAGCSERAEEQDELPALFFAEFAFKGGHGLVAFADFVEKLAIGDGVQVRRIGEVGRIGVVALGIGAVAFAGVPVAVGAFVGIDGFGGGQRGS